MKLLQFSNAFLVVALLAAATALVTKSLAPPGAVTALALPAITFAASFVALQREAKRLSKIGLWLNALLLALFIAIDVLALFVFNIKVGNAVAIIAFQAVAIALPATANIVAFKRLRDAT
jgi:hypothetical protein